MSADWQQELTFSDRLQVITKILAAYKEVTPGCEAAKASQYARSAEEKCRKDALSLAEYHDLISKTVQILQSSRPPREPIEDHHADEHVFPNLPNAGATIGRYTHANHVNDGLFSEIFQAVDPDGKDDSSSPKVVALKITTPSMMKAPHDSIREGRILTLAKGPNILPLLDTFQQPGGRFVLVFPFIPLDLATFLRQTNRGHQSLDLSMQRSILRDLFAALSHIHSLGIIHRDVKPSNILLVSPRGPAYIADFGIAWSPASLSSPPENTESASNKILDVGTTCYRPPELLFGNTAYTASLDLWAAGCVVAEVVCRGLPVHSSDSNRVSSQTLFDAGDLGSELALIKSIFSTLGTPDEEIWPEAKNLPDWGKMRFQRFPRKPWEEILPGTGYVERSLVEGLVRFESATRTSAADVHASLSHDVAPKA